jgi:hypothetical protein
MDSLNLYLELLLAFVSVAIVLTLFDNARRKHRGDNHK